MNKEWLRIYRADLEGYMRRWIMQTPWGTVRVHHILRSDDDRALHDHPWSFVSFLLSGGYTEYVPECCTTCARVHNLTDTRTIKHRRFSLVRRRAEDAHRLVLDKPVWTFVITGPKRRTWGFYTKQGWVPWRRYCEARNTSHAFQTAPEPEEY